MLLPLFPYRVLVPFFLYLPSVTVACHPVFFSLSLPSIRLTSFCSLLLSSPQASSTSSIPPLFSASSPFSFPFWPSSLHVVLHSVLSLPPFISLKLALLLLLFTPSASAFISFLSRFPFTASSLLVFPFSSSSLHRPFFIPFLPSSIVPSSLSLVILALEVARCSPSFSIAVLFFILIFLFFIAVLSFAPTVQLNIFVSA